MEEAIEIKHKETRRRKRLKNFLRRNNCLNKYKRNTCRWAKKLEKTFLPGEMPHIGSAFLWDKTPEGAKFWSRMDVKFNMEVDYV